MKSWIILPVVSAHPKALEQWQSAEFAFFMLTVVAALAAAFATLATVSLLYHPLHELAERIALSSLAEQPVPLPAGDGKATQIIVERYNNLVSQVRQSSLAMQARVVASEGLSTQILSRVPSGIIATDKQGIVVRINPAAEAILELEAERVLGLPSDQVLGADHPLHNALRNPTARLETDVVVTDTHKVFAISSASLPSVEEESAGVVVVFSDLTTLHELRATLELKERLASLGELAGGLAHELRNPLGALRGFVELLEQRIDQPERAQKLLKQITRESDSLAAVVSDFLAFARVSPPLREALDSATLLADARDAGLSAAGVQRACQVVCDDEAKQLWADRGQLHRALVNFVINACQATDDDGHLLLGAMLQQGEIVLFVDDDGPGIAPALRSQIPTPFMTTKSSGTGLGLAVCHQIAQAHGGTLLIEQGRLGGARVGLRLPLGEGKTPAAIRERKQ